MEVQGCLSRKVPSDRRFFSFFIFFYAISVTCIHAYLSLWRVDVKGHSSIIGCVPSEFLSLTLFTFVMFEMMTSLISFTDKEYSGDHG